MTNQSHKLNMRREKIAVSAYWLCEAAITNTPNLVFKAAEVPAHSSEGQSSAIAASAGPGAPKH